MLLKSKATVFVKEALYIYRCGQSSTMNNNNARKNLDIIEIMRDIRDFAHAGGYKDGYEFLLINHVLLDAIKRLQLQSSADKKEVIHKLRSYVKESIPKLSECESFKKESGNRRMIMRLNYYGMEALAIKILKIKSKLG